MALMVIVAQSLGMGWDAPQGRIVATAYNAKTKGFIPGSALVSEAKNKANQIQNKVQVLKDGVKLVEALTSNSAESKEVEKLMQNYLNSQKKYLSSLDDKAYEAEKDKKKEDAKKKAKDDVASNSKDDDGDGGENGKNEFWRCRRNRRNT